MAASEKTFLMNDLAKSVKLVMKKIGNVDDLVKVEAILNDARASLESKLIYTLQYWTTMWRDAYNMIAHILAADDQTIAEFAAEKHGFMDRLTFCLNNYQEWVSAMKYNKHLTVECGDFTYNPLAKGSVVADNIHDWCIVDNNIIVNIDRPFHGETDWYSYRIPCEYFNILHTEGHKAARLYANDYFLRRFIVPYLDNRFNRESVPKSKNGRKLLKSDLRILKQELVNINDMRSKLEKSNNAALILIDGLSELYEKKIKSIKSQRKMIKEEIS